MGEGSKIEWTDHTFNPWYGCTKISPACDHCYAEAWAKRSGRVTWGEERIRTTKAYWRQPLKWNAAAEASGTRPRVFCASLADVFDNQVPDEWRQDLYSLICETPHLDWLLLTKRIGNVRTLWPGAWDWPLAPNIWLGATIANQEELRRDVPKLLDVPARVRFLSCEPLLGPLEFGGLGALRGLHWVICGGESGSRARPLELRWAADLRAQAESRGISFFMKQGSQANWEHFKDFERFPPCVRVREFPVAA